MGNFSVTTLIGILVVLAIIAALVFAFAQNTEQQQLLSITNFDECVAAGNSVMETYPEQCRTPDGRTFVNERQVVQEPPPAGGLSEENMIANGCAVAGCSGTLCVSADEANEIFTTCEYRPEYACYREAVCEPQAGGKCGWTQTPELLRCLANSPLPADAPSTVDTSELYVY